MANLHTGVIIMLNQNLKMSIFCSLLLLLISCGGSDEKDKQSLALSSDDLVPETIADNDTPRVKAQPSYPVLLDENIIYAQGLSHNNSSSTAFALPLKLDIYYPDNNATNRPALMFIHGGGFTGGVKHKPEIVEMANFYASRGWVFISIDYRTTEELGSIAGKTQDQIMTFYQGIAPQEWLEFALQGAETPKQLQQSIAMYATQRDAKAALRWINANSAMYYINTNFITVGGASAGAITTIALGISDQEDFRDEISLIEDPTLATTNLAQTFSVKSMIYFWGSNAKLELFESVYGLNRYDGNDPELFMAHGTAYDPVTPFSEAIELQEIYEIINVYNQLIPLEGQGHGAWDAQINGKGLSQMSFDFIVERQYLQLE